MALIPAPGLQIDIFVTNFRPLPPPRNNASHGFAQAQASELNHTVDLEDGELAPPTPGFARHAKHSRRKSVESVESDAEDSSESYVDLSYYSSELVGESNRRERDSGDFGLDHEGHILDLTNFDGDNDEALPGEEALNRRVKKQGKLRRAKTRKATRATVAAKERLHERRQNRLSADANNPPPNSTYSQSHTPNHSQDSARSTDRLLSYVSPLSVGIEKRLSATMEVDLGSPTASHHQSHLLSPGAGSPYPMSVESSRHGHSEDHHSNWDSRSDTTSIRHMMPRTSIDVRGEEIRLEIEEQEMHDVNLVSEHARPGKPKIDRIVADEVENSKGSMIVACKCI